MAKKYELDDLLRVREIRKDRAEKNLKKAQQLLKEAEQALAKAQQELEDYKNFVIQETQRLYNQVLRKSINKREIDNLHFMIKELQDRIFDYQKRVEDAMLACDKAKENLDNCREELRKAERNIDKIESLKDVWREEMKKEEERQADAEVEDFTAKPQGQ
ncbi:MAG: type III secretion protein [Puniceicoccales bacterium]|jgi:flagellar biosynthesis chaperone FliJ|nr:type III secretion protein [Puniceicoccales bacterium]